MFSRDDAQASIRQIVAYGNQKLGGFRYETAADGTSVIHSVVGGSMNMGLLELANHIVAREFDPSMVDLKIALAPKVSPTEHEISTMDGALMALEKIATREGHLKLVAEIQQLRMFLTNPDNVVWIDQAFRDGSRTSLLFRRLNRFELFRFKKSDSEF